MVGAQVCNARGQGAPECLMAQMHHVSDTLLHTPSRAVQPSLGSTVVMNQSAARAVRPARAVLPRCGIDHRRTPCSSRWAVQSPTCVSCAVQAGLQPSSTVPVRRSPARTVQPARAVRSRCGFDYRLAPYSPRWAVRSPTLRTAQPADPVARSQ